jgi:hypothetical protein
MPGGFVATKFSITAEPNVLIVRLGAPSTDDDDFYLTLQHKNEYSAQDVKFGWDQPYIEYCGQGWSWYGHILEISLRRNCVTVRMDEEAAAHMNNDGIIEVQFDLDNANYHELRSALRQTFQGCTYYCDVD